MIVIVAPYSPPNRKGVVHLGASRKIEAIISAMSGFSSPIVLVNSAHNEIGRTPFIVRNTDIGGVSVKEIILPHCRNRAIGKFSNLFHAKKAVSLISSLGIPKLFWFYNGYAFEMLLALKVQKLFSAPTVLEFEDWHFARERGWSIKPYVDYLFWYKAARGLSATFAVNKRLADKMRSFGHPIYLLPGIVPAELKQISTKSIPFESAQEQVNIGYFGGLSIEKGAGLILELIDLLPEGFVVTVTGTGPLEKNFGLKAEKFPAKLKFHGKVRANELYSLISKCDVIVNLHDSIADMGNGIFPFKVIEAIASARLLISTEVPKEGLVDCLIGVESVPQSLKGILSTIIASRTIYNEKKHKIAIGCKLVNERFGEENFLGTVRQIIERNQMGNA